MDDRKRISDRFLMRVVLRHKEQIFDAISLEQEINSVINAYAERTGRTVEQMEIVRELGSYTLKLKVSI